MSISSKIFWFRFAQFSFFFLVVLAYVDAGAVVLDLQQLHAALLGRNDDAS